MAYLCDLSDEITIPKPIRIITDLCRISFSYLPRPNKVKPKLKQVSHESSLCRKDLYGLFGKVKILLNRPPTRQRRFNNRWSKAVSVFHRFSKYRRSCQCCFRNSKTAWLKNAGFSRFMGCPALGIINGTLISGLHCLIAAINSP